MEQPSFELRKYLKMVVKRRYLFLAMAFPIMSIIAWGSFFLPKQYEASSTVFIESHIIKSMVQGIAITPSMGDRIRVLRYAMLSRGLIAKVLRDLDVDTRTKNDKEFENLITAFQGRTKLTMKGGDLFIVSLQDPDSVLAMNYVNTLVRRYVEENLSAKKEEAYGATRFLEEQVVRAKEKLDSSEQEIIDFRKAKGVYIARNENIIISEIRDLNTQMEGVRLRKNELTATLMSMKKQLRGEEPMIAILTTGRSARRTGDQMTSGQAGTSGSDRQIMALEERLRQLLVRFTDNYPEVVKLRAEIDILKRQSEAVPAAGAPSTTPQPDFSLEEENVSTVNPTYQQLKEKLMTVESEISAVDAKQNHIAGMIRDRERELRSLPEEKKRLSEMESERAIQGEMYDKLRARLEQSIVSKQMEVEDKTSTFRIVDPAVVPGRHATPDRATIILFGILAGIVGGVGIVYLRELFDSSVKDTQTLKDLGLTVLAVVPRMYDEVEQKKVTRKDMVVYSLAGCYFLLICSVLTHEMMGWTFIDTAISRLGLDGMIRISL